MLTQRHIFPHRIERQLFCAQQESSIVASELKNLSLFQKEQHLTPSLLEQPAGQQKQMQK